MVEKIKIVIVEDESIIAEDLSDILLDNDFDVPGIFRTYFSGIQGIERYQPDLVLLDIKIRGEKDGIDLAQAIRNDYRVPFIFISSHSDPGTVKRASGVNPYGYLIKPFEDEDVLVSIEIALSNFAKEQSNMANDFILNDCLFVREKNLVVKIPMSNIQYVRAEGNYSTIITNDKSIVLRSTLKDLETKLPGKQFYRSHKSYIINLEKITAINSESIYVNDERLPIGRGQLHYLMESINKI